MSKKVYVVWSLKDKLRFCGHSSEIVFKNELEGCLGVLLVFDSEKNAKRYAVYNDSAIVTCLEAEE